MMASSRDCAASGTVANVAPSCSAAAAPGRRLAKVNDGAPNEAADPELVRIDRVATGGAGVGRRDSGQVVFVPGALPGETARIEIVESKKRFARARLVAVIEPGPQRRAVDCQHARSAECGGCDWMHIEADAQRRFKTEMVADQLQRLGRISDPRVDHAEGDGGPRTTVRCVVTDEKAGYRALRSHETFAATSCSAAHPLVEELIVSGRFGTAEQVTLRASVATGQRVAVIDGGDPSQVVVPGDVVVVSAARPGDGTSKVAIENSALHETVADRPFRISAGSFFQASAQGAAILAAAVADHANDFEGTGSAVDLYGGVGLLGAVAVPERLQTVVEWNAAAVADARHNMAELARLGHLGTAGVTVERAKVERWAPTQSYELALADPARRGLGQEGVDAIGRTGATELVVVNCDPAAAGRDAALLIEQGWVHMRTTVVDLFPDTSNVEAVSSYRLD